MSDYSNSSFNDAGTLTLGTAGGIFQPDKPFHLTVDGRMDMFGGAFNVKFGSEALITEPASVIGEVNVTGANSKWSSGHVDFAGTLAITDGGMFMTDECYIGRFGGSSTVTVSGAASRLMNSGTLDIARKKNSGSGNPNVTMNVTGGGVVEASDATVGANDGIGIVTVSGSGSLWNTIDYLTLGSSLGSGTVNIQPGGTVRVGSGMTLYSGSRVRLQGGTLDTGAITFSGGGTIDWNSGRLSVGLFHGDLGNYENGVLAPGHSAGSTSITGFYEQRANGTLEIEIGGTAQATQYDVVNVMGQALLNGQLKLQLINGFVPTPSQIFVVMSSGATSGSFANVTNGQRLTTSDGGGSFLVHYGVGSAFDPTLMVLSDFQVGGLHGDYNQNGTVDAADYVVWRNTLGQPGSGLAADGNGNNQIDEGDYGVWRANFGRTSGSAVATSATSQSAVPEPSGLAPLTLAVLALLRRRHRLPGE